MGKLTQKLALEMTTQMIEVLPEQFARNASSAHAQMLGAVSSVVASLFLSVLRWPVYVWIAIVALTAFVVGVHYG